MVYSRESRAAIAVYPKRKSVMAFLKKIKDIFVESQNKSAIELITKLNPIIRG